MGSPKFNQTLMNKLFLFAGEASGDLHGAKLMQALKEQSPDVEIWGVGGPRMRKEGLRCVMNMEEFQVMGFIAVFRALPSLMRKFYAVGKTILKLNPNVVVLIDYPGFNLRMARYLSKKKFPGKICQYVCPTVWAWGKKRIPLMEKHLDLLISFLPFEKKCFHDGKMQIEYVGHPLAKSIQEHAYQELPFNSKKKIFAIFPGSRKKEIELNLPTYLTVIKKLLTQSKDFIFALSIANESFRPLIIQMIEKEQLILDQDLHLVDSNKTYELMKQAHFAWAKSGTVTLELALHQVPTIVTYGIAPIDLFIAKNLLRIRLPFYSLPNIILGESVFPELIGPYLTASSLYEQTNHFLYSESIRKTCLDKCHQIYTLFADKDPQREAARAIYQKLV